jgi:PTH1 family peptidyl-tRNA hydrolase
VKLIVGLGNPGRKYAGTRHNVGFRVAAELARMHGAGRPRDEFQGEVVDAQIDGQKVLLLCPHTLMNLSGISVRRAVDFYHLAMDDVLVVCDDMDLTVARLRFRARGSAGGQKGLADVIRHLGTDELARLRVGIGRPPQGWDAVAYVLGKFTAAQAEEMDLAVGRAADAAAEWVREGIAACMNKYNAN